MKSSITCDNCKNKKENKATDKYYCPYCGSNDTSYSYSDYYSDGLDEEFDITICNKCGKEFIVGEP